MKFVACAKAIADPTRLRIFRLIAEQELCVCQVIEVIGLAPSTISKHLAILLGAGLVLSRKRGRWIYYRRAGDATARSLVRLIKKELDKEKRVEADLRKLKQVLSIDPEILCRRQARRRRSR
ncbi:MAG: ArsR family transcriptional regulator [Candidatus Hydrogenedentota bacterium]|nr:MAG: ArsR family transcriptional regulator [Candidatus Hydrogenedentota bacterium]